MTFLRGRHSAESKATKLQMVLNSSQGSFQYICIPARADHSFCTVDAGGWKTSFWARWRPADIIRFYLKRWLTFMRGRHLAHRNASNLQMVLKSCPGPLYYNYNTAGVIHLLSTADGGGWKTAISTWWRPAAIICVSRKQWLTFLRGRYSAESKATDLQMVLNSSQGPFQYICIPARATHSFYTVDGGGWKTAIWAR